MLLIMVDVMKMGRFVSCLADLVPEDTLVSEHKIGKFEQAFSHEFFKFGGPDRFTFRVHVFGIKDFVTLQVR